MKPHLRPAISFIAGRLISNKLATSIYDYSSSKYLNFNFTKQSQGFSAYDYTRKCHISISLNGCDASIYDYSERKYIDLKVDGEKFSGYDYGNSEHFSGTVNSESISLYDNETSKHYSYSL